MPRREVRLGPKQIADGVLVLRSPRLRDAAAWSAARLANRDWLERAFPAWGDDWAAEQSPAAWVQRWWRLRRASGRGRAKPLMIVRDGVLVGELGVDAVDERSGGGEASVWMVQSHGSADVMGVASLLLIEHAFTDPPILDRLVSPVATSSRKGRAPGLTAAGLRIEGTVPRKVGEAGLVDHDIWTVQNTAAARTRVRALLDRFPDAEPVPEPRAPLPLGALARALVRGARAAAQGRRRPPAPAAAPEVGGGITLSAAARPGAGWRIERAGATVGGVTVVPDLGTGCVELELVVSRAADRDVLGPVLPAVLDSVRTGTFAGLHPAVRVAADGTGPTPDQLAAAGLTLVATFAGNPEGTHGWPGEQRWEPAP